MSYNKFFDVFIGPPWCYRVDTWPGVSSLGNGSTISNYYKFPIPDLDPPTSGWTTPGGFVTGGKKKKTAKPRPCKKKSKKKYKKSKKNKKSKRR